MNLKEKHNVPRLGADVPGESADGIRLCCACRGALPGLPDGEFSIDGIMIILCHQGEAEITIDGKRHKLAAGSVAILPEKHIIRAGAHSEDVCRSMLFVSTDFILDMPSPIDTNIFVYSRFIPVIDVSAEKLEDFGSHLRFIGKELRERGRYRTQIIKSLIYALLLELTAEYEEHCDLGGKGRIRDESLSDSFFRLLAANFREQRSVGWYAGRLSLTPKYLSQVIRHNTGRSILDWIHESVMIEAKMLLKTSGMTVQQISDQLNFSSPSAFVQFYRRHGGVTPGRERG